MNDSQVVRRSVTRIQGGALETLDDAVAVERPLEIRVDGRPLSVTLRTPGDDEELAIGFLAGEGIVARREDVAEARTVPADCADRPDAVELRLAPGVTMDWSRLERHFAATAACGLCGRSHLESLRAGLRPIPITRRVSRGGLAALPARLRESQATFAETGGLHGAGYCGDNLELQVLREDVGRHNAVDKVVGWLVRSGRFPAAGGVLWVSGRAGSEIALKAARARIPVLAAVGAPSSLAIEIAEAAAMTLIGFLREGRMNVYCGLDRLEG